MATRSRRGASGAFGGALAGLNGGLESDNKNRFKRIEKESDRRFQINKMLATNELAEERNQFNREQVGAEWDRRKSQKQEGELMEDFPDQYTPRRGTFKNQLDPEELEKSNNFYRGVNKERSKRGKMKSIKERLQLQKLMEDSEY